uniref:Uncharacterized protein LOC100367825 n=1 Tax=Saccoglossus kowalevskii TaxID=10224 RepID=A0ABM0MAD5_SACKO|nr:PREDICTED: uncharacterized protein LOC100367825 [Saccoglossus kowalevskii]
MVVGKSYIFNRIIMGCGASATIRSPAEDAPRGRESTGYSGAYGGIHGDYGNNTSFEAVTRIEEEEFDDDYYDSVPLKEEFDQWISDLNNMNDYADHQALLLDKSKPSGINPTEIRAAYNLDCAKVVLWNAADCSPRMCWEIGKYGIIEILLSQLKQPEYAPNKLTGTENYSSINADRVVRSTTGILHNVIRNCLDNRHHFREANAVELLSKYIHCKHATIQAVSVLILAYIVKDEEVDKISTGDEIIKFLLLVYADALNGDEHMSPMYMFEVTEIVDGLIYLAANDANKVKFVNNDVLPLLVATLTSECSTEEHCLAATAIWTLAFHADNKDRIRKEEGCLEALTKLQHSDNSGLKKACNGALWELRDGGESVTRAVESSGHVMISYQWNCQKLMVQVKNRLKDAGFKVWMDVEQMGGSTLEAMAGAVENADVVLMTVSEKYKDSQSCRSEAEYAYKRKKTIIPIRVQPNYTPDGWLGIIEANNLYYDFSAANAMATVMPDLIRELEKSIGGKRVKKTVERDKAQVVQIGTTGSTPLQTSADAWTNSDVSTWLMQNNLSHMKGRFSGYTGEDVKGLKSVLIKAPEFFYSSASTDKGIKTLLDVVKLERALEKLD